MTHPGQSRRGAASVQLLYRWGLNQGLSARQCLADTGLSAEQLTDPQAEIEGRQEWQLVENLVAALGDDGGQGVQTGELYHLATYGIWGFALMSSPTFRDAALLGIQFLELTFAFTHIQLREHDGRALLTVDGSALPAPVRRFMVERDVSAIAVLEQELFGVPEAGREVWFSAPAPKDLAPYHAVFQRTPLFGQPLDALVLSADRLDQPLPLGNPLTQQRCVLHCQQLLDARLARRGLAGRVRDLLVARVAQMPDMEQVAAELGLCSRTLRRQLAEQGVGFRQLRDEVRQGLAEALLHPGGLAVEQVAARLGYPSASNFIHAFRRWTGQTPGRYVRQRRSPR